MDLKKEHHLSVRVYYEDTDAEGIVYHSKYLNFAERARTEFLRSYNLDQSTIEKKYGLIFVVKLINIEEGYYAVIRYSGNARDKNFDKHAQILRTSLIEDKVQILGPSIKAIYNGPFTLPIMRRNEAMFKVEWKKL